MTDLERFHNCYDIYGSMVFRLALNQLGTYHEAEDAAQEVFIKWLAHRGFQDQEHEKRWLIRVTINYCRNIINSSRKRCEVSLDDFYPAETGIPEEKLDLTTSLMSLDGETRSIIYLYYYEGYSVKEIARMLSISPSKVKIRLSRGRQKLKLSLEVST